MKAVSQRAGEIFAKASAKAAEKLLDRTRAGIDEPDDAWADAVAVQQQLDHMSDLDREVRARDQMLGHVAPVTSEDVNTVELVASLRESQDALDSVRAAADGDDSPPPARPDGQFVSTRPAVTKWDLPAQARGERLFCVLREAGLDQPWPLHAAMTVRPAWLNGGVSVAEAVMDRDLEDRLHTFAPVLAARVLGEARAAAVSGRPRP